MGIVAKTSKIITAVAKSHWGGIFCENGFFVVLEIKTDEQTEAQVYGKKILDNLLIEFTQYQERNLETIGKLLQRIKDNQRVLGAVIGALLSDNLYLGSKGLGVVYLGRKGKVGKILSPNEVVKGKIERGDRLLFYSQSYDHVFGKETVEKILTSDVPFDEVKEISSRLLQNKGTDGLVVLFCHIEKETEKSDIHLVSYFEKFIGQTRKTFYDLIYKTKESITEKKDYEFENESVVRQKKTLLSIAVVLIILLLSSIFWNISYTKNRERQKELTQILDLVTHQYEEAESLVDLNPGRARQLLSDSKLSLSTHLSRFPKNSSEFKEINEWLAKISEAEVTAYKIFKLTAVPLFYDLTLIKQEGWGDKIASYKEDKAVLDTKNKVIYRFSSKTKQGEMVAGSDVVGDAKTIDIHGKNIYIVNSQGIVGIDSGGKNAKVVMKLDEKWGEITALASYGGNLYLLDKVKHIIWKYMLTDFGFSNLSTYLNSDVRVNLSESRKMVIDGSVWVLISSDILKFSKGLPESFAIKGFADALTDMTSIATDEVSKYLYILDRSLSRILVFGKDGDYYSQYQWDGLKDASDVVISEEEKKIFVLSGSKIYAIEIK